MFVEQFYNKNQFIITDLDNKRVTFQSYQSTIAEYDSISKELVLFSDWNYSATTRKHLYLFINEYTRFTIPDVKNKRLWIEKQLKDGIFVRGY